ncbi:MAG TPA: hypothetical protein VK843_10760, partial [Planctomycetota bacterium]|nr:hypothetical protein [Planctomycetota bacterium]
CSRPQPAQERVEDLRVPTLPAPAADADKPADLPGLHNVVTYHDGLYSGSVPYGEEGFKSLAAMGVRTVISVDGAAPDVDAAEAHGLRYVHLPVTYSGFSPERELEIARAVRDLPGPVYVHCHHGKHRSAGATGAAAVALGYLTPEQAIARMKVSGTAPSYKGLYQCVSDAEVADKQHLDKASAEFPSVAKTSGLVESMVEIDEISENLKAVEKAAWMAPSDHPDLLPLAEAGRLENLLRNLKDDPDVKNKSAEFHEWLDQATKDAQALEDLLAKSPPAATELTAQFQVIAQGCKQCHVKYRD